MVKAFFCLEHVVVQSDFFAILSSIVRWRLFPVSYFLFLRCGPTEVLFLLIPHKLLAVGMFLGPGLDAKWGPNGSEA